MKAFVVLAVAVACASAQPQILLSGLHGIHGLTLARAPLTTQILSHAPLATQVVSHAPAVISAPIAYSAPAVIAPAVTKTQYHSQDELGQASYGHSEPGQAHAAVRDAFGNVAGSYAYINPEGKEIRVNYIADGAGFRVESNALPVAPTAPPAPAPVALIAPIPVEDTDDVKEAKAAHAKAVAEAVARNAEADKADAEKPDADKPQSRRKRGIIAAAPIALTAHHVAVAPAAVTYSAIAAPATVIAAPAAVVAAPAVREATLTKIVNNPLHAVSYRVD